MMNYDLHEKALLAFRLKIVEAEKAVEWIRVAHAPASEADLIAPKKANGTDDTFYPKWNLNNAATGWFGEVGKIFNNGGITSTTDTRPWLLQYDNFTKTSGSLANSVKTKIMSGDGT